MTEELRNVSKLDPVESAVRVAIEEQGKTFTEVAPEFGVARSTLRAFCFKHNIQPPAITHPGARNVSAPTGEITNEEKLQAELKELRASARKERGGEVEAERLLDEVRAAVQSEPPKYEAPEASTSGGKAHVHNLLLSDLHGGEVVDPEQVNGMNEFHWDILEERIASIHSSLLSYIDNRPYPVNELVISMLGDMVGGAHHQELAETNEFPVAEQSYRVGMLLGQFVEALVPYYPKIRVPCVEGNHARLPKKPAAKNVFDSFDWLAYKIAEQYTKNYETVEWDIAKGNTLLADIAGNTVLLFHGDGIRSSMPGVPWGGVTRRTNELRKQYASQGVKLDAFQLGHFHQANAVSGGIFMNGSVKGPDEWVLKQFGNADQPEQLLLTYNAEKERLTDVSYITP